MSFSQNTNGGNSRVEKKELLRELSEARMAEIESFFGLGGKFPAVKIDKRLARGVGTWSST
jgi:hypothetical protein